MSTPDAPELPAREDDSAPPERVRQRLLEAYRRYDLAYGEARPGTRSAAQLAGARLDLTMLLVLVGEDLSPELLDQMSRDGESVLRTTPALVVNQTEEAPVRR